MSSGLQYYIRVYGYGGATNFSYRLNLDWTQPIPEDAFEPNESYMAAPLLPYGNRTYEDLTIHAVGEFSSSEDWFGWTAPTEGLLDVSVQFLAALGDIDLGLYDAAGTLLSSSGSTAGNIERVTRSVQTGELYYIRVYGYNGARNAEYDLVVRGPEIAPDFLELNDSWETAMDLGMGGHAFESLTIHAPGNSDWYRWTSPANGVCAVDLAFNHVFGDIDVALLDENLVQLDISNGVGGTEQVSAALSAGQTVYVHVYGFAGTRSPGYSMVLAGPEIVPDILEPNDSLAGATVFGGGDVSVAGMSIHATGNSDWYRWIAPSSGVLDVTVLFTHALGDVDLQLYDQNGSLLLASESVDDDEQLGYRVDAGASYYIRVYGVSTVQVPPVLMEPKLVVRAGTVNSAYELIIDGPDSGPTLGDMDLDGDVDFDDIDDFVLGLNDPSAYEIIYGVPPSVHGDTDQDGDQDFDDIDDFVDLLISSSSEDTAGVSAVDSVFTETETGPLLEARRPRRHDRERAAPLAAQPSYGLPSLFRQVQRQRLAERTAQRDDAFPVAGNGGRGRFPDVAESEAIAGSGNRFHGRHTARRR